MNSEKDTSLTDDCAIAKSLQLLVAEGKKFGTIYADPPWAYSNKATRSAAEGEYRVQSVDWMCDPKNMPVAALSEEKAHIHLWTTNGFLFEAKRLIDAWGFVYKSCFVWVKPQMGIGNYWRVSHEFLLLGVRGGLTFKNRSLMSWSEISRTKHSRKPPAIRNKIESTSPGPRLELFARITSPGWTVWGDEIEEGLYDAI